MALVNPITLPEAAEEPTRRTLLNMAIAAPVAAIIHKGLFSGDVESVAAPVLKQDDTPVMRWFREWVYWIGEENRHYTELGDETAADAASDNRHRVEEQLMALPCQDARDFVAKVVAYTDHGEFCLKGRQEAPSLWREARALLG